MKCYTTEFEGRTYHLLRLPITSNPLAPDQQDTDMLISEGACPLCRVDRLTAALKQREAEVAALAAALRGMVENATSLGASHPHLANYVHHPEEAWTAARAALADPPVSAMSALLEAAKETAAFWESLGWPGNNTERARLVWLLNALGIAFRACNLGGAK